MVRPELIEDPKDDAGDNHNASLTNDAYTLKPKNNSADLPGNRAVRDMSVGEYLKVDHNQMKDHPAEAAEGVDHMIIVKWDTTATKFGYDTNNQLITTTMVYGAHPAPIQRYLGNQEAKRRTNDPKAEAAWYEVPHGFEGKIGIKPSEFHNHLYSEFTHTYIFEHGPDGQGTELTLGKEPARGWFTSSGTFVKYDNDGDIISIRNTKDLGHQGDNLVCHDKNAQIMPYYKQDKKGNPLKVDGRKVFDQFEEIASNGKFLHAWVRDGKTENFFRVDYTNKSPTVIKLFQVNISENGLAYSDKPKPNPVKDQAKIAAQTSPQSSALAPTRHHDALPSRSPSVNAQRQEAIPPSLPPVSAQRRAAIPPPPPIETARKAIGHKVPPSKIMKDGKGTETSNTTPVSALATEYADTIMTIGKLEKTAMPSGDSRPQKEAPLTAASYHDLPVDIFAKPAANAKLRDIPIRNLPTDVFAQREPLWIKEKDIPENLQIADEQTGVHIDRIKIIPYPKGEMVIGYNDKNEQVLIKSGDALYINPNESERTALGKPNGKPGWYLKESNRIRKTRDDNYGVSSDNSFVTRDKSDPSLGYAYVPDGQIIKGKCNAVGALIESNTGGSIKSLRRTDHTVLTAHYVNENDSSSLNGFEEINAAGNKSAWTKVANTVNDFAYKDAQGNEHIRKNVVLAANGNLSYIDEKDVNQDITTIVRSNGVELKSGNNLPKYCFDNQGRFARIEPSPGAIRMGARIREFAYVNNLNEDIAKVFSQNPSAYPALPGLTFAHERIGNTAQWTCVCYRDTWDANHNQWYRQYYTNPNGNGGWPSLQGQVTLDQYGSYSHQDFIIQNGVVRPIVRTWHTDGNSTARYV